MAALGKARGLILRLACKKGDLDGVLESLEKGADINGGDQDKWTPLHIACFENHPEVALKLIERGANVNARNIHGQTPLSSATSQGQVEVVRTLIEKGADLNSGDWNNNTALHVATMLNQKDVAVMLLIKGCAVNAKNNDRETPLHWAAKCDRPELAKAYLYHKANPCVKDKYGDTPRDLALKQRHKEIANMLQPFEDVAASMQKRTFVVKNENPRMMTDLEVELNKKVTKLERQIKEQNGEICRWNGQVRELQLQLQTRESWTKKSDELVKQLQTQLDEQKKEREKESCEMKELKEKLEHEMETFQKTLELKQTKIDVLSNMVTFLQDSLTKEERNHLRSRQQVEEMDIQLLELKKQLSESSNCGAFWDALEDEVTCIICAEKLREAVTLNCAHTFCQICIDKWKNGHKNDCPSCRAPITSEVKVLILNIILEKIYRIWETLK